MIAATAAIISCDVTDSNENDTGQLTVQLTDAPGDFEAVYIDIEEVRVKSDDFDEDSDEAMENDADDEGWITINDEPMRVNLLDLRNGDTIQLGSEELTAGVYNQIRFVLGSENEVQIDGRTYALSTPSAQQSGLKLNIDAQIENDEIYNLLVDFDAGRSVVETGNQQYILKPVLRAVSLEETGQISGTVEPADIQTSVMAIADNDTLSTLTEDTGDFSIIGVTEGTYRVVFAPQNQTYGKLTQEEVSVAIDEDVNLGTITLEQQ